MPVILGTTTFVTFLPLLTVRVTLSPFFGFVGVYDITEPFGTVSEGSSLVSVENPFSFNKLSALSFVLPTRFNLDISKASEPRLITTLTFEYFDTTSSAFGSCDITFPFSTVSEYSLDFTCI